MDEIAEIPQIQSFAFLKKVGIYLVLQKHLELFKKLKSLNSSNGCYCQGGIEECT